MIWVHTASAETLFIVGGSKNAKAVFLLIFLKTERARFAFYLLQLPLRVRPPNAVGLRSAKIARSTAAPESLTFMLPASFIHGCVYATNADPNHASEAFEQ
ncbi:hypothetical protein PMI06_003105 [Burkholderia sp. BT03]|nr:hypothetical protein PMI06_003105 [Burkholderia sp. BT03]SKC62049.1 hypothetical protein SAMN06266956_1231 [Paraburkholderia hospita]